MADEPPAPARRDPPPERPLTAAGERPAVPPPPVRLVAPRTFAEVEAIRDGFGASTRWSSTCVRPNPSSRRG